MDKMSEDQFREEVKRLREELENLEANRRAMTAYLVELMVKANPELSFAGEYLELERKINAARAFAIAQHEEILGVKTKVRRLYDEPENDDLNYDADEP